MFDELSEIIFSNSIRTYVFSLDIINDKFIPICSTKSTGKVCSKARWVVNPASQLSKSSKILIFKSRRNTIQDMR